MNIKANDELIELTKSIEASSEDNRNFFVAYLLLLIYVQAVILSTTDLQLLISSDQLKLPFVDLFVSLDKFYLIAPIFVLVLHFNLLQNLDIHHLKLTFWRERFKNEIVPVIKLQPFLFDHAVLHKSGKFQKIVQFTSTLLFYNFAPLTLGLLLIRYSDKQDGIITLWHFVIFLADIFLLRKTEIGLGKIILYINYHGSYIPRLLLGFIKHIFLRAKFKNLLIGFVLFQTILTGLISFSSNKYFVRVIQPLLQPIAIQSFQHSDIWPVAWWNDNQHFRYISYLIESILPRITIKPSDVVWKVDVQTLENEAKIAGYKDWLVYFNEVGKGFKPSPKSLRFIQLPGQNLPRIQLQKVQMQGANLMETQLQHADLEGAMLQGATLEAANLDGANLRKANLRGAYLNKVNMRNADLSNADLVASHIPFADLEGADLSPVNMVAADLEGANLQGVLLYASNMSATNLVNTQLQGALLEKTIIDGAYFEDTNLAGAIIDDTIQESLVVNKYTPVFIIPQKNRTEYFIYEQEDFYLNEWLETIPTIDGKLRLSESIKKTKITSKITGYSKNISHDPKLIMKLVLPSLCGEEAITDGVINSIQSRQVYKDKKSRVAAVKSFRQMYLINLPVYTSQIFHVTYKENFDIKIDKEYMDIIKDMENSLCSIKECSDLVGEFADLKCNN